MATNGSAGPAAFDVFDVLIEDHNKISRIFAEFQKLKALGSQDEEAKQTLVEIACTELAIHAQVEEEFLYPALRAAFDEPDLLEQAEVEHLIATQLVMELESMQAGDLLYDARFTVLGEYVKHHIEEEQNRIFPKARASLIDLATLGQAIRQRRDELRTEFGMPDEEYEEDEPDNQPKHRKHAH